MTIIAVLAIILFALIPYRSSVMGDKFGYECECLGYKNQAELCFGYPTNCQLEYGDNTQVGPAFSIKLRLLVFAILLVLTLFLPLKKDDEDY